MSTRIEKCQGRLTVYFEDPFWVGVFERIENGKLSAAKVTFGAEPKEYEVQEFINNIENSHDRRIVTMRVIDGLPFKQIAKKMGGGNTEDGVRQAYFRILKRNN